MNYNIQADHFSQIVITNLFCIISILMPKRFRGNALWYSTIKGMEIDETRFMYTCKSNY